MYTCSLLKNTHVMSTCNTSYTLAYSEKMTSLDKFLDPIPRSILCLPTTSCYMYRYTQYAHMYLYKIVQFANGWKKHHVWKTKTHVCLIFKSKKYGVCWQMKGHQSWGSWTNNIITSRALSTLILGFCFKIWAFLQTTATKKTHDLKQKWSMLFSQSSNANSID